MLHPKCDSTSEIEGWSCCTSSHLCGENEGDCDISSDCQEGLVCGYDNCLGDAFHPDTDCCTVRQSCDGHDSCCREENLCAEGEGDCDGDGDCMDGLQCGTDNCQGETFDAGDDCCFKP